VQLAAPAALLAAALAVPLAYVGVRRPGGLPAGAARAVERAAYVGYATPPLAFGLALVVFVLAAAPWAYQTLGLLVVAVALHLAAEAVGPVRSALYRAPVSAEWAAQSLGRSAAGAFGAVTLPHLRGGIAAGAAFVFLSAMKELPLTFVLAPLGFRPLAMGVWGAASEAMFAVAAPYALAIVGVSALLVALLLRAEPPAKSP
jgi:iron(III) transport system permease protein